MNNLVKIILAAIIILYMIVNESERIGTRTELDNMEVRLKMQLDDFDEDISKRNKDFSKRLTYVEEEHIHYYNGRPNPSTQSIRTF